MSDNDNLATLLGFSSAGIHKSRSPSWGKVASIKGDYVNVVIWSDEDGTNQTVKAVRCCNPAVNDIVALENIEGKYRAVGIKGYSPQADTITAISVDDINNLEL